MNTEIKRTKVTHFLSKTTSSFVAYRFRFIEMKGSYAVASRRDGYFPLRLNVDRAWRPLIFRRRDCGGVVATRRELIT